MATPYNHKEIEKKWRHNWDVNPINADKTKPKYYCLDVFPYPSGSGLHVGHLSLIHILDIIGVYEEELVEPVAQVLINLGVKKGMVVFGQDTMDEITPSTKTTVCEIRNGETKSYEINPEDYGISICKKRCV